MREVSMHKLSLVAMAAVLAVVAVGCGEKKPAPRPEEIAAQKVQQAMEAGRASGQEGLPTVKVAPGGTRFDPPVQPSQIPPGAWYCDMGTVHYARLDRGNGRCPECGMPLTRQPGAAHDQGD
jgi:hypothetical protein